jgi:methyl-accepting chemotaxis protein
VHWPDGKSFKRLASTFGDEVVANQEELRRVFDGAVVRRDAILAGHPAAPYVVQIRNYANQPIGVLEVIKNTTAYEAAAASSQWHLVIGTINFWLVLCYWHACSGGACRGR